MKTMLLTEVFESSVSGYWGSEPGTNVADVRIVRNGDIKPEIGIRWEAIPLRSLSVDQVRRAECRSGDMLVTTSGECGVVAQLTEDPFTTTCASNFVKRLRVDETIAEPRYVFHFMARPQFRHALSPFIRGTTIQNLSISAAFGATRIPLPPLAEQRRIASILDHADALRARRRHTLNLLDTLTQSIFIDMFGDPFTNPMAHSVVRLPELGSIDRGVSKHRPRNAPELLGGSWPLIQTGDVSRSSGYVDKWTSTYSDLGLVQSRLWPAGTLCITIAANIARTAEISFAACFPDSIVGFSCEDASITRFVRVWFTFMQSRLESAAPESAQKNINLATLRSLSLPLPGNAERQRFLQATEHLRMLGQGLRDSQEELEGLCAAVKQRAFSGNL